MSDEGKPSHSTKKCPYCSTHLIRNAPSCTYCKKKVGPVDKHGIAQKPVDWKAYTACILSWTGLMLYFWVLGWSDPMLRFFKKFYIFMWVYSVKFLLAIWGIIIGTLNRIMEILIKFNDWMMN